MNVQFFDSYPYRTLEPDLQPLLLGARRLDAAVAFVTRPGVALLRQYLKTHPPGAARLVASVRFPTNLRELANLEDDFPGTVFLHTGFQAPIEKGADRGQFHSKVALVELDDTERCIILGSHNWTGNALHGHNMEAGVILRCQEADAIVAQVRQHIEACARRSEAFVRQRLPFYETIQRDLHR
ncbi:MAG: phospholipase D-like domain-containing protein, partial [Thermoguttaceae bacterium]